MGVVSAGYVGGRRGSGIVSGAADMFGMSVVHRMRGVGEVCEMCMYLARGWRGDERIEFEHYQSCGKKGSVSRVSA